MGKPNRKMQALVCAAKRQNRGRITFTFPLPWGTFFDYWGKVRWFQERTYTENKQTDFYRKITFVRKGIISLLQPKKLEKIWCYNEFNRSSYTLNPKKKFNYHLCCFAQVAVHWTCPTWKVNDLKDKQDKKAYLVYQSFKIISNLCSHFSGVLSLPKERWLPVSAAVTAGSLLEAWTLQIDNIILSPFLSSLLLYNCR